MNTRFVGGVVPPTIPPKTTFPVVPALKVTAVAPLSVLENVMVAPAGVPPPLVVSKVGAPDATTGPVRPIVPPDVVMLPATLIAVDPV